MTTDLLTEVELRHWLVDYLVTHTGCSPSEIDLDASLNDLGVGSRDAVVLAGELSELLGRPVSPIDFWEHPTINALAGFLTTPEAQSGPDTVVSADRGPLDEAIAVIGMGCRLPGGISGPDALWEFLCERRCAIGNVPPQRWQPFDDGSPDVAAMLARTTRWGSFLSDIDAFDAEFFEISPGEASKMDPQQRLLLEVTWEALEHAGIPSDSLRHSQTGVFAGACLNEYGYAASTDLRQIDAWSNTGGAVSIIANRLSYFLDLRGPSVVVDTACSSSLVAVHLACQSLRMRDCHVAIAAGVNLLLSPAVFRGFDETGALSPTGQCRAFDADADGFVRGEGAGVAVLKRLTDAVRDGDQVLAVVRGSAVNQDGRSNGLMAPNPAAQMAVLRTAYANAGFQPREVDYVEAHGTGTLLGDPIEARALGTVLGRGRREDAPLLIGAVKSNLGHLEAAAGIAGFIKAVLAVQCGRIPPNQHFENPNPHIPFEGLGLKVVAEPTDWPETGRPRRAGVSSFGFGGTNAHVVIEQGPEPAPVAERGSDAAVSTLVVSGKTPQRVAATASVLAEWMAGPGAQVALADVAHTLNHHRARQARFATVAARDRAQAVAGLRALGAGEPAPGVVACSEGSCGPGTVFVYSGRGSQWAGMGRRLLADEPAFAAALDELEPVFVEQAGFSLLDVITAGKELVGIEQIQLGLIGMQLALTALWGSYGVQPDMVIGHSMGEVAAAVVAGALTPADGLRVTATRARLMAPLSGRGGMALLELDAADTEALIAEYPSVSLAIYASPRQTVIAGPTQQIDALIAQVRAQNRFAGRVNIEVAPHNPAMDLLQPRMRSELADLAPQPPSIPIISTTYEDLETRPVFDAQHWATNMRNPVRFAQAITAAGTDHHTFIEISAHPLLAQAILDTLHGAQHGSKHASVGTLQRETDDTITFRTNLNTVRTTHPPQTPHPPGPHPQIPTTPWQHTRHWIDTTAVTRQVPGAQPHNGFPPVIATPSDYLGGALDDWCYQVAWPARPLPDAEQNAEPSAEPPSGGRWLALADTDLAAELSYVAGPQSRVDVVESSVLAEEGALIAALSGVDYVLYAPSASGKSFDVGTAYQLFHQVRRLAAAMAVAPVAGLPAKLFIVTRNAQPVAEGDRANPSHGVLWGLGRTLALERPEIWGGIIDLDDSVPAELAAPQVLSEATSTDGEDQVVYRLGVRHVPRLHRRALPTESVKLDADTSQLVIGATGNVGPHLIRQLARMGAKTIVAVSRNPGSRLQGLTQSLAAQGTNLVTVAADATDRAAMSKLFDRFGNDLPPLEGIYLAAFAGGPVLLSEMTDDDVRAMFAPKLDAAALLHRLSLKTPVRHFVFFSSISGLTGSRWLAHYTATSGYLDSLAYARRALGLPATTVNWGLWKSLADAEHEASQVSVGSGLLPMDDEIAISALPLVMSPAPGMHSVVVDADWPLLAEAYRTRGSLHIVDDLVEDFPGTSPIPARDWSHVSAAEVCDKLETGLRSIVARELRIPELDLETDRPLAELGLNSLMAMAIRREAEMFVGIELSATMLFNHPTVASLAEYLAKVVAPQVDSGRDEIAELSASAGSTLDSLFDRIESPSVTAEEHA